MEKQVVFLFYFIFFYTCRHDQSPSLGNNSSYLLLTYLGLTQKPSSILTDALGGEPSLDQAQNKWFKEVVHSFALQTDSLTLG